MRRPLIGAAGGDGEFRHCTRMPLNLECDRPEQPRVSVGFEPSGALQQCRGLEQGQTHHARVAPLDTHDERGGATLDRIAAGLAEGFAAVDELVARGAVVLVHDPLYTDEELARHGWAPYHFGEPVDVAIVHTDHTEYAALTAADFPRLAVLVDGRARIDPARFPGVRVVTVGKPDQLATEG